MTVLSPTDEPPPPISSNASALDVTAQPGLLRLYTTSLTVCATFAISIGFGFIVYRFAPLHDRIEVVGAPLLRGYSEANEQFGFYAFWLCTLLLPLLLHRLFANRLSSNLVLVVGAIALLGIVLPPWMLNMQWLRRPLNLPLVTFVGCAGFLAGCWANHAGRLRQHLWLPGLVLWCLGFPKFVMLLVGDPRLLAGAAVVALVIGWIYKRSDWRPPQGLGFWVAVGVVACSITIEPWRNVDVSIIGFLCTVIGLSARTNGRFAKIVTHPCYLVFVGVLTVCVYSLRHYVPYDWWKPSLHVGAGVGAGLIMTDVILRHDRLQFDRVFARFPAKWLVALSLLAILTLPFVQFWLGVMTITVAGLAIAGSRKRRPGFLAGCVVSGLLFLFTLPTGKAVPSLLDVLHDGSVLSAVWEFESGRELFSEVFPLRTYQFFVCWLGRDFLPHTLQAYHFSLKLMAGLPFAAVALMTFVWSRSLLWSFATGLAFSSMYSVRLMDSRQAMHMLVAAVAIEILRSRDRRVWLLLFLPAFVATFVGYDCLLPLLAATLAATFVVPEIEPRTNRSVVTLRSRLLKKGSDPLEGVENNAKPDPRRGSDPLSNRLLTPAVLGLVQVVPVTVFLIVWQSGDSAVAYWSMLVEYVRNYASASGRPIAWGSAADRYMMMCCITVIAIWTSVGSIAWSRLSDRYRRLLTFVVIHYVLLLHRGIGRSYTDYWIELVSVTFVLGSLGLYELLRALRQAGLRSVWTNWQVMALCAIAVYSRQTYLGPRPPWETVRAIGWLEAEEINSLQRDEFVTETVAKNETLWGFEYAITNYAHRRHSPTRHPLAMCIVSPEEQRRVVEEFEKNPPRLIQWQYDPRSPEMKGTDGVPRTLRYYVISQYLFQNYQPMWFIRPRYQFGFLEPAWNGKIDYPNELKARMNLGRLPLAWGQDRIPIMSDRIIQTKPIASWRSENSGKRASRWQASDDMQSRVFNYLKIIAAVEKTAALSSDTTSMSLELAVRGQFETETRVSFDVVCDGNPRTYLVPIGCNPAWSWRPSIKRIRLEVPAGQQFMKPDVELWQVDDLRP